MTATITTPPKANIETYLSLHLDQQYATLCALGDPEDYERRYRKGIKAFPNLISTEGVSHIGIDWQKMAVVVGTDFVEVEDSCAQIREFGHYIIAMSPNLEFGYTIENVTGPISNIAHPHAMQNSYFCMADGNPTVKLMIVDGEYPEALSILMAALYMQKNKVNPQNPYGSATLDKWPIKQE